MSNITELNQIKSVEAIELMDRVENAIIETGGLTPIEIIGVLEMMKARYTLIPLINELNEGE